MRILVFGTILLAAVAVEIEPLAAQDIPHDKYLNYMPLDYRRIVRQTDASAAFQLYGNPDAAGFLDEDPRDGVDDTRGRLFHQLGVRFAPYLVKNTTAAPMDFKKFMDQSSSFLLHVDRWNIGVRPPDLDGQETIDWANLLQAPCEISGPGVQIGPPSRSSGNDDCRLVNLLQEFDPFNPTDPRFNDPSRATDFDPFTVMYFNFPGDSPESWKKEYEQIISGNLPRKYQDYTKIYVHPFLKAIRSNLEGVQGYEFVLQYWLFYPFNDGGNNHEGDWEHLNVAISPMSAVERNLTEEEVSGIMNSDPSALDGADPLVIKRIDFYFHHQVMMVDFGNPNVYLPQAQWDSVLSNREKELVSEDFLWKSARYMAYQDDAETIINTHPIGYIGADNKGLDQLLAAPGGKNRDSHGTYPFTGLYKDVGPGGSTEQIKSRWDHRKYFADVSRGLPTEVAAYDLAERVEVIPDWEVFHPLLADDPAVRQDWSWMVLPIRWGYPASESPFAGFIPHAETGNLAPPGPTFQSSWNTSGASAGFHHYNPHKFSSLFPLGYQDTFNNSLGFINAITATLLILPPIDFLWRVIAAPFRAVINKPVPVFFPTENVPFRFVGISAGAATEVIPSEFNLMFLDSTIAIPIFTRPELANDTGFVGLNESLHESSTNLILGGSLFLGKKLVTTSTFRNSHHQMGVDLLLLPTQRTYLLRGKLNLWEWAGSIRYNLATEKFQPYAKIGYGLSWYRLEDVTTEIVGTDTGPVPVTPDAGLWVRQPWRNADGTKNAWANMWPNTMHFGAGIELIPVTSRAPIPRGIDVSLLLDWTQYRHALGLQSTLVEGVTFEGGGRDKTVTRNVVSLFITLGF
jgi:hypothetical protein